MLPALIIGLALIGGCASAPQKQEARRWSCNAEVYELAQENGVLFARTSGGIVSIENDSVRRASKMPMSESKPTVDVPGDGAFVSATADYEGKLIASYWGGKMVFAVDGKSLSPLFERPAAQGDYVFLAVDDVLYAGTNNGLFARKANKWIRIELGGELPFPRVHGMAKVGSKYVLGGIEGVAVGNPGNWNYVSREPVRQILQVGHDIWILYGSGAVDKLTADGKLYADVLYGAAKRPWSSSLSGDAGDVLMGGHGGWIRKGASFTETYPAELSGEVVTAILAKGATTFIGTQAKGLAIVNGSKVQWINPGVGLSDTWVTCIATHNGKLLVATASAGLFELRGNRAVPIPSPSTKLRNMALHKGDLVIGALDGAWIRSGAEWRKLNTDSLETTAITTIDNELWIGTPAGIFINPERD